MPPLTATRDRPARGPARAPRRKRAGRPAGRKGRPPRRRRPVGRRLLKWAAVATIWGIIGLVGFVGWIALSLPSIDGIVAQTRRPSVTILAADGTPVARYGDLAGSAVSVAGLPPHLIQAVLATEDRRFYSHPGVDPLGVLRALVVNIREGRTVQGGSTITQQLAKNLFLTPERTWRRKAQEALLAFWLEASLTKDEILAAYLNRVYLGAGTYGVDAAARTYFGVPASEVSLHQAAILAGLLRAPSRYSPLTAPQLAEQRAETVLAGMVDAGYLTSAQIVRAESPVPLPRRRPVSSGQDARYFADWANDLVPDFTAHPGDMVVRTTLSPELQRLAEGVVAGRLAAEGEQAGAGQAALVALAPDGAILAMVGGRSYASSQFNRAVQAERQPGSAFKPFVYLAALQAGLRPDSIVLDGPIDVGGWRPGNFSEGYAGEVTVADAFVRSLNTAAVRVLQQVGIAQTVQVARAFGISAELRPQMSLALGTSEVTLLELTAAYAGFLDSGRGVIPYAIRGIDDADGGQLYRRRGEGLGEAARPWHVWELVGMMEQVMRSGTGRAAAIGRPAAGKTGTSQDYRDAWFVGFTADLVVGVWVGNDDGTPMRRVTGGGLPARIWHDFMEEAHRGLPARPLPGFANPPAAMVAAPVPATPPADPIADLILRLD